MLLTIQNLFFLSNQKFKIQSTLINLHPNDYSQKFHYYPFAVKLDRCVGNCNTMTYNLSDNTYDLSNKLCIPNKTEDLNLSIFNIISGINKSKTLKSIFHVNVNVNLMEKNVIQINGGITINVNVNVKNIIYVKNIRFGILLNVIVKMENI